MTVAYDGTNYHGWQEQPGEVTVEGELNKALTELTGEEIRVTGASRTDAGVHAYGNLAAFDSETPIPAERLPLAVNTMLPADIRVVGAKEVMQDFHPRKTGAPKTYTYHIACGAYEIPTRRLYSWFVPYTLDTDKMNRAARDLIGEHDFAGFSSSKTQALTTVRTIYRAEVTRRGDELIFTIEGSGFLYNMVRILAGTLVDIGRGHLPEDTIRKVLENRDRTTAGQTAPPEGLFLEGYRLWEED